MTRERIRTRRTGAIRTGYFLVTIATLVCLALLIILCLSFVDPIAVQVLIKADQLVQVEIARGRVQMAFSVSENYSILAQDILRFAHSDHEIRFATLLTFRWKSRIHEYDTSPSRRSPFDSVPVSDLEQETSHLSATYIVFPLWAPIAFLGMWPLLIVGSAIVRRRQRKSRCECKTCGYLLYGNQSGQCPECGMPIPEEQRDQIANVPNNEGPAFT